MSNVLVSTHALSHPFTTLQDMLLSFMISLASSGKSKKVALQKLNACFDLAVVILVAVLSDDKS